MSLYNYWACIIETKNRLDEYKRGKQFRKERGSTVKQ
jgi:hypothetical protein